MLLNPYRFSTGDPPLPGVPTTWDPANKSPRISLSDGDRRENYVTAGYSGVRSIAKNSSGKWYVEITRTAAGRMPGIVTAAADLLTFPGGDNNGLGLWNDYVYKNDSVITTVATGGAPVIGLLIDLDARTLQYRAGSATSIVIALPAGDIYVASGNGTSGASPGSSLLNAGQDPFAYVVPDGYAPGFW